MLDGASALITGGAGFIGSNLARRLLELGARVTIVDSFVPEHGGNRANVADIAGQIDLQEADVRDRDVIERLVAGKDYLFSLAGQTSHLDSMRDPFADLDANARAQLSILEACRLRNPGVRIVPS